MATEASGLVPDVSEQPVPAPVLAAQDVDALTRAFLVRLMVSFSAFLLLVAGCFGLATNRYDLIAVIWAVIGPLYGGLVYHYLGTSVGAPSRQLGVIAVRSDAPTGAELNAAVDAQPSLRDEVHPRPRLGSIPIRTLSIGVWAGVAILISAGMTVGIGALTSPRADPWLLGIPFLAMLAVAMMVWLWADQHVRRQSLAQMARAGQRQTRSLQQRSAVLMEGIDRRQMQRG